MVKVIVIAAMELDMKSRTWLLHSAIEYRKKTNLKVKDPKFIDYMFEKQREKGITLSRLQLLSFVNDPMGKKGAKNSNLPTSSESSVDTPARTKQPPQQPRLNTNDQDAEATSTGKHTRVEQKDFVKTKGAVKMESRMKNDSISYKNDTKNIAKIINPEIVEVAKTLKSEEDLSGNEKIRKKVQGKAASVRASKTENVPAVEKTKKSDIINMPLKQMCFNVGDKKQLVATTDLSENHVHPTKEVLTIKTKKTKSKTITPEKVLLTPVNADVDKPESDNKQIQIKLTPGKNLDESRKTPAVEKSTTNSKTVTPSKPVVKRAIAKGLQDVPLQFEIKKESEIEVEITNIPSSEENKISEKMDGASQVAIGEKISKGTRAQKRKKGLLPGVKPDDETEETSKTEMKSNNISPNNKIQVSENHDSAIESTVKRKRSSRSHSSSSSSSIAELKPTQESQSTSASPSATTTAEISSQGAVKVVNPSKNETKPNLSHNDETQTTAKVINPEIVEEEKTFKSEEDLSANETIRKKVQGKAASEKASKREKVPAVDKTKKTSTINMPIKQMCFNVGKRVGDKKQLVATTDLSENHVDPTKEVLTIETKKTKSKTITPEKVLLTPVNADVDKPESDNKQIQIKVTPGKNLDESPKTPAVEKSTTNSKTVTPSKPVAKKADAEGLRDVPIQFENKTTSEIEDKIANIPSSKERKISENMDGGSQVPIREKRSTRSQSATYGVEVKPSQSAVKRRRITHTCELISQGVKPDDETEETSKTEMKSNNISPNNKIQVSENHDSAIPSTVKRKRSSRSHSSSSSSSIAELKPTQESQSTSASPSATTTAEISSQDFEPNALEDGESQEYKFKVGQNSPSEEVNSVNPVNGRQATVGGKRNTRSRSACSALKVEPDTQPPSKKPRTSNTTGNNSEVADQNTGNRNDTDIKRELIKQEFIKKERRKPKKVGPVRKAYLQSRKKKYNEKKRMEREMQLGIIPVPSLSCTPQSPYIPMVRPHVYSAHCWQRPPGIIPLRPRYFPRGNKPRFPPWPHNALNQHHRMQPRMNFYLPVNVTSPRQNMGYPRQYGRLRAEPVEHTGSASTRCNDNFDPMRSYPSTARFSNSTIEPQKEPRQEEVMAAIGLGPSNFERTILQEPTGMDTTAPNKGLHSKPFRVRQLRKPKNKKDDSTNKSEEDTLPNFDPILFPFKKIKLPAPQTLTPPLCSVEDVVPILEFVCGLSHDVLSYYGDAVGSHQSTDSSAEATAQDMESSDTATGVFSLSQSDLSANLGTEGLSSLNSRVGQSPPLSPSMLFPETPRSSRQSPSEESSGQNIIVEANNNTVDSLQEDGAKKLKAFGKRLLRLEARDRYRGKQLARMERANQKRFMKTQYIVKDIAKTQRKLLLQFTKFVDEKNKK
ncbi:platelet binding protein GspB-like isoform X8 [Macrosteles quadrilineatus]|uniref:platelet binding protein GspB-like isoform X8 n=1 Tax=Macrosteles quadrilineatus TaxID=74068 RepID=UPI0023E24719|nr:platelet binding protein GspB-like isoform X8 [Macrosteles quadrilineatus]